MKEVKIVGFVSEFHYHDFVDACKEVREAGFTVLGGHQVA